jgi:hypothetical protein
MKSRNIVAHTLLLAVLSMYSFNSCYGQLPPTNMGKFIHQPGDNQYTQQTQMTRHGTSYVDTNGSGHVMMPNKPAGNSGHLPISSVPMGGSQPTGPKIDVSLEPISADEPIPPAGFPPLPLRLDLPVVATGVGGMGAAAWTGSGAAASSSGQANAKGGARATGYHQHYAHYQPGAFANGGGNAQAPASANVSSQPDNSAVPGVGAANESSIGGYLGQGPKVQHAPGTQVGSGYYKCRDASAPIVTRGDSFNSNTPGVSPPKYSAGSEKALHKLGKAPDLSAKDDAAGAPEAPTPVLTSQSTTQDLSLPDDEHMSRHFNDSKGKRFMNRVGRSTYRVGRSVVRRASGAAGIGF